MQYNSWIYAIINAMQYLIQCNSISSTGYKWRRCFLEIIRGKSEQSNHSSVVQYVISPLICPQSHLRCVYPSRPIYIYICGRDAGSEWRPSLLPHSFITISNKNWDHFPPQPCENEPRPTSVDLPNVPVECNQLHLSIHAWPGGGGNSVKLWG